MRNISPLIPRYGATIACLLYRTLASGLENRANMRLVASANASSPVRASMLARTFAIVLKGAIRP